MDGSRFDNWTRNRAVTISRRRALQATEAGGFAAATSQLAPGPVLSQFGQATCKISLHVETAAGPSAPAAYDGVLEITLDGEGLITKGSFTPTSGAPSQITGSASGRAIDMQIALSGDEVLVLAGVGVQPVANCNGPIAGLFSGPQPGDIGTWELSSESGSGSGSTGSSGSSSGSSSSGSTSSSSLCLTPRVPCGPNCCPTGSTCTDPGTGLCPCPAGTEQCGNECVPSCDGGQLLNLDTCECPEVACTPENGSCNIHADCCTGYCGGGTCFVCNGKVCGDFGCIDPSQDQQNCGNCGNVCIAPQVCVNGVCGCKPNQSSCGFHSECCSKLCFVNTCIDCSEVNNGTMTFCGEGACVDLTNDIDHCGACFKSCPRTSGAIACCNGICADLNYDETNCYFCGNACAAGEQCHLADCIPA